MTENSAPSFFDSTYQLMKHGPENPGEWQLCYARQTETLLAALRPGMRLLDVGCGPSLPYAKPAGVELIGLEPSFQSLRHNAALDLKIAGSAYAIPLADASIDVVVCFYAIHHMVGRTVAENEANVRTAFAEFGRVLKPGGRLLVFEMTPGPLFGAAQALLWNTARRALGAKLDMHFFSRAALERLGSASLPIGTALDAFSFDSSPLAPISPIFSLPRLKVPRFVYPLGARLYRWHLPT
ncbi:MAG TPA: class I SAM-dependent methyltransferase [Opitutaceae bacterium]|nr:class I SAM-dependent methyltransferase [Opitutaceae bacterium]